MTQRPSGWYDDPQDESLLRYWDGILWSDRTMPKIRPGLDHVGQSRPVEHVEAPARRDGEPRTYPAHWGPESPDRRQHFQGPHFTGIGQPGAPFGNTIGTTSGLLRRILATFIDQLIVALPVALAVLPFVGSWMERFQRYIDAVGAASKAGEQIPALPSDLAAPPLTMMLVFLLANFVYETLMTTFAGGSTLAKKMLGITVVPSDSQAALGGKLPLGRSALRALIKCAPNVLALVSALALFGGIAQCVILLWALGNVKRQGLHDLAAKSEVRRTR